ncbi:MAG TPA: WD40 repeat domain-containing protein, partial [Polyangiaceae bacterium]|nr:WD40 repeat domain-containing protein [Polyangiaceae bacterium]
VAAAVLVAAGCGGRRAAPGAARPTAAGASSSAGSVESCAVARQQRARAPGLLGEGKLHRTLRVLAEADRRCPAGRPETWAVEVEALAELGRSEAARELARTIEGDPRATDADRAAARRVLGIVAERDRTSPDPEALYAAARNAKRAGRAAEAQRLLDRAVSELERVTGAEVTTDAPERMCPATVTWSPDGALLAVTDGMDVVVREVATLRERVRLGGHGSVVSAVAFSPDGTLLVTGSYDRAVRRFRLRDGAALRTLAEHDAPVTAVAFSRHGDTLLSVAFDGDLRWTRAEDGVALGSLPARQPHVLSVPSPDGSLVAVISLDGSLSLRRARDGAVLHELAGDRLRVVSLTFSPDGSTLAAGSIDGALLRWRVRDGAALHRLDQATGSSPTALALSPDGSLIAVGLSGAVRLLRAGDGAVLHDVPAPTRDASVGSVAFSPDGGTLAAGQVDGALLLARVRDGAVLRALEGHGEIADAIAFSPDGRTLATGTYGGAVRLWRTRGGPSLRTLPAAPSGVMALAFSPDGRTLASAHDDELVRLWDAEGGALLRALPGHRYRELRGRLLAGRAEPRCGLGQRPGRAALRGRGRGAPARAPGARVQHDVARVLARRPVVQCPRVLAGRDLAGLGLGRRCRAPLPGR